eukprot:TRINITY_DN46737_c0_g1_i1.p1 TRINITY_DN46737_c0_g1~~TRINITY_DN46737_c0_g1_i1.p1  ORF type:complete len:200 (+),score=28.36 TRINITY_DN46737_c0_g1_i1:35-601(+)
MASGAASRLVNGEAVRNFLLGRWTVSKSFDYRVGGGRGTLEGIATFTATPPRQDVLMYEERGTMNLDGLGKPVEAYRHYCFNTGKWPVEVYFVNDPTKTHLPTLLPELDCHTSFFIPLPFGEAGSSGNQSGLPCGLGATFKHLCVEDLYSGQLEVKAPDHFEWNWSVVGPNKDGTINASYHRLNQPDA